MEYKIFRTKKFEKELYKLPKIFQAEIEEFEIKLINNPQLGKPLNYTYLREKRIKNIRIYYLVYEEFIVVMMVEISDKKLQQATIDKIKENLDYYHEIVQIALKDI